MQILPRGQHGCNPCGGLRFWRFKAVQHHFFCVKCHPLHGWVGDEVQVFDLQPGRKPRIIPGAAASL